MEDINVNDRYLQPIEVIGFFVNETGPHYRATNVELISHFRPLLMKNTSSLGQENHTFLKHITGKLAVVKKLNGEKYLELRPEFRNKDTYTIYRSLNLPEEDTSDYDNNQDSNDKYFMSQERQTGGMEAENHKSLQNIEDENSKNISDISEDEESSSRHNTRVRFTEDTARSRAPISLNLLSEIEETLQTEDITIGNWENDTILLIESFTPAPPIPPHSPESPPPPLPPKPIKSQKKSQEQDITKTERKPSTGFETNHIQLNNFQRCDNYASGVMNIDNTENETDTNMHSIVQSSDVMDKSDNDSKNSGSDLEEDDSVFPLPDFSVSSPNMRNKRALKRDTTKTASVKDLIKFNDQIVSNQAELSNKSYNNKELVGVWRCRANVNTSMSGGDSGIKSTTRNSTSSDDFFVYRPLDEAGKRWILAGTSNKNIS